MKTKLMIAVLVAVLILFGVQTALSVVLNNPTITGAAPAFDSNFVADNLFDGRWSEYASQSAGAGDAFSTSNGTWVEMDFGSAVTMDRFVLQSRNSGGDVIGESRLILSDDPTFGSSDTIFSFSPMEASSSAPIFAFDSTTARYARWEVATSVGSIDNLGGNEMRFMNTPNDAYIASTTAYNASSVYSGFSIADAVDGNAGHGEGREYVSAGDGVGMYIDFDFGVETEIVGFDFFDRVNEIDRTTSFDLIFSNEEDFWTTAKTLSFSPGDVGWGFSAAFDPVSARYV